MKNSPLIYKFEWRGTLNSVYNSLVYSLNCATAHFSMRFVRLGKESDRMLELKKIVKTYTIGDETVTALDGISICFRRSEFVSILGPSGCGKTTLLNIIGGLDHYTDGDLVINGRSTKD